MYVSFPKQNSQVLACVAHGQTRTHAHTRLLLLRIRTLAGEVGGAAAAMSQHGLELSENWPCISIDRNVNTVQV